MGEHKSIFKRRGVSKSECVGWNWEVQWWRWSFCPFFWNSITCSVHILRSQNVMKLKITGSGFMNIVHRPKFHVSRKHNVSETGSAAIFRWGETDTYSVWSVAMEWPQTSYLEIKKMDKFHRPCNSECYVLCGHLIVSQHFMEPEGS
jgi:hypothetical protein